LGCQHKQRLPKTGLLRKSAILIYADSNGCPNCAGAEWILIQFHSRAIEKEPEKDATAGE
jgi:hypothetical protein